MFKNYRNKKSKPFYRACHAHAVTILSAVIKHRINYTKYNVELTNNTHKIQKTKTKTTVGKGL